MPTWSTRFTPYLQQPWSDHVITEITLQLESKPGVHLRVVGTLKKLGLITTDLKIKISPSGGKLLTLQVETQDSFSEAEVMDQLQSVLGVADVLKVGKLVTGEYPVVTAAMATPEPPARELSDAEKRFKNFDSEAGDEDIRDRMLVFSLLSRYPKLAARLIELRGSIPEDDRDKRFYQIGVSFGKQLFKNLKVSGNVVDVETAIEKVLLPGLAPLAQVNAVGNLIKIDIFNKSFDHGKPDPANCLFIQGMIDGLLRATPSMPASRAYKTKCVHTHDVICEYNIVSD